MTAATTEVKKRKRLTNEEKVKQAIKQAKQSMSKKPKVQVFDVSLDKVAFVGDIKKLYKGSKIDNVLNNDPNFNFLGYKDGDVTFMFREKFHITMGGKSSMKLKERIRIEFNPNKVDDLDKKYFKDFLTKFVRTIKFTRIDVAIDVRNQLKDYKILMKKYKKKETFVRGTDGELETMYFGTRNSEIMYRIYDKKREQKLDDSEPNWWRVEVVYRREKAEDFTLINPFWNMIISQPDVDRIIDFEDLCIVERILKEPKDWSKINKNKVTYYKALIAECSSETDLAPGFGEIFEKKKSDLLEQITQYKELCSVISKQLTEV